MILETILKERQAQGYTVAQIAKLIGKSEPSTHRYLYGEVNISLQDTLIICEFLGIEISLQINPKQHKKNFFLLAE
jgi:transcriptional regulator with XRE-family HTH domain